MKILFLSRWFPFPVNNGSKIRISNLLRGLGQQNDVTLLSFNDQPDTPPDTAELLSICSSVHSVPWREFDPKSTSAKLGFLSWMPRSIIDTFSSEMAEKITELIGNSEFDLIIASQLQMAAYFPYFQNIPALFEELEIGLVHGQAFSADGKIRLRHALTWFKLRMYLSRLLDAFQAVTVASEREEMLVRQNFPHVKDVFLFPNCINMDEYRQVQVEPRSNTLIFTGSFRYRANYEAMQWFVIKVFPLVLEKIPDAELIVTGDPAGLSLPIMKNVTLAGHVDDIKSQIAASTLALAPLWIGGGTRLKILEAMAIGTPVVATTKGAEGLDAVSGEHLLIADDPMQFSEHVLRLLSDSSLRQRISQNAAILVSEKYDWKHVLPGFSSLLTKAICL
jgi:polysaccharide biosynthesis protein PslH